MKRNRSPIAVRRTRAPRAFLALALSLFLSLALTGGLLVAEEGPVVHWTFDDTLADASGNGHDLTVLRGTGAYDEGFAGRAFKFDGSTCLQLLSKPIKSEDLSVSVYYWMEAWTESDNGQNLILVNEGLSALGPGAMDLGFIRNTSENPLDQIYSNVVSATGWMQGDRVQSQKKAEDSELWTGGIKGTDTQGAWHHLAVVVDQEAEAMTMYLDGTAIDSKKLFYAAGLEVALGLGSEGEAINVGGLLEGEDTKRNFKGLIDDLKIFTRALSAEEVLALAGELASGGTPTPEPTEAPTAAPTAAPTEAPTPTPSPTPAPAGGSQTLFIVLLAVIIVGGVVAALLILRKGAPKK